MKGDLVQQATHRYVLKGSEPTVRDASQLIGKLPNGWTLDSLMFERGNGWVATVIGPVITEKLD